MKRVRIMFAAIIIMGAVGAMLAFKAYRFTGNRYCYKINYAGSCTGLATAGSIVVPGNGTIFYTTTNNPQNCVWANCLRRAWGFEEE